MFINQGLGLQAPQPQAPATHPSYLKPQKNHLITALLLKLHFQDYLINNAR